MDCRTRRNRRGRCYSNYSPAPCQPWSFVDSLSSFIILSSLAGLIYMMLEYHCNTCHSSCNLNCINKSIADIAKRVACMTHKYQELEQKISRFSQEIPKLEGQFELIEAIYAIEKTDPRKKLPLPNVDVFLNKPGELGKNVTFNCPKCSA